ncbi:MAG: Kiwa anti-phage protein KwaB-like domain-containing protein [Sarcina sp.]
MNKQQLQQYMGNFNREDCTLSFVLGHKKRNGYNFKTMGIHNNLQPEVLSMLLDKTNTIINACEVKGFNSLVKEDDVLEYLAVNDVEGYRKLTEDLGNNENIADNLEELGDVNFYFIQVADNERHNIKIFRRYSKSKTLSKGIICRMLDNTFNKINESIIQIEENVDFIVIDDTHIFIANRYSFETITNYKDKYIESLGLALDKIEEADLIENFAEFKEDCQSSIKIAKQFNEAMKKNSIDLIQNDPVIVVSAIRDNNLPIDFVDNKFVYEGKEHLGVLVALLSDRYVKTLIGKELSTI